MTLNELSEVVGMQEQVTVCRYDHDNDDAGEELFCGKNMHLWEHEEFDDAEVLSVYSDYPSVGLVVLVHYEG